ncbi:MAG: molecular chaperone GrpE, partial [Candidatus Latescibacterota bacterium]
ETAVAEEIVNQVEVATEAEVSPLETVQNELVVEKDRYLRLFAEFENYKKRTSRERIELFKTASQDVMVSILPVMDDLDRALNEFSDDKDDVHVQGMVLISNKLKETLKQKGLDVVETKQGDVFDAEIHEAITQIPSPSPDLKGKIIDVIEKGYALGDKTVRFPKVVIGN